MGYEEMSEDEMKKLAMMFGCEHSTLITIMTATVVQLREFPIESWHPSMAAVFMAINALKASYTAAYVHGDKDVGDHLYKMFQEVAVVIHKHHVEGNRIFNTRTDPVDEESKSEIPDAFKKAFERDTFE